MAHDLSTLMCFSTTSSSKPVARAGAEFEAEGVAHVVCQRAGLATNWRCRKHDDEPNQTIAFPGCSLGVIGRGSRVPYGPLMSGPVPFGHLPEEDKGEDQMNLRLGALLGALGIAAITTLLTGAPANRGHFELGVEAPVNRCMAVAFSSQSS